MVGLQKSRTNAAYPYGGRYFHSLVRNLLRSLAGGTPSARVCGHFCTHKVWSIFNYRAFHVPCACDAITSRVPCFCCCWCSFLAHPAKCFRPLLAPQLLTAVALCCVVMMTLFYDTPRPGGPAAVEAALSHLDKPFVGSGEPDRTLVSDFGCRSQYVIHWVSDVGPISCFCLLQRKRVCVLPAPR